MWYPVPGAEAVSVDGKLLRGPSRNKLCIGIGCDKSGRSYFAYEGLGKTSGKKAMAAFGAHIECGSRLAHDMEKGHHRPVRELGLADDAYSSKLLAKLDDKDSPLREVNRLCCLVKRFLNSHSGFNRDDLGGWLNLFSVAMSPPKDKMEKVEVMLNGAMGNPKIVRFRDFYNVRPSSEG
jgi:hypothetical protein